MYIKISWADDFDDLMLHLRSKYGKKMFDIDGIGEQLDLNKFSKDFFKNSSTTADVSVDANANVVAHTGVEYNYELAKPLKRYNSYYLLWKELRKQFGHTTANEIIELQLTGAIYINDFTDVALPYCFNYSTYDIYCNGLVGISKRMHISPPKSFDTFIRQLEQFTVYAANSTLGATGFADIFIVGALFVEKILETGYDGHLKVDDVKTYLSEKIRSLIYTLNWEFRGNQSPFSNVSVMDKYFLESLRTSYTDRETGKPARIETIQMLQDIYINAMNSELERSPLTFPVTTACFSVVTAEEVKSEEWKGYEVGEIKDKEFLKYIAEQNLQFGFINFYCGETSQLSSCCRLRSGTNNEYFNSFGAGSTKIGSLGVVTVNFPRLAMQSKSKEEFLKKVSEMYETTAKINNAKRSIIKKRVALNAAPLYSLGYMSLSKQYSTFGVTGLNEAVQLLGMDILEEEGQDFVIEVLKLINEKINEANKKYKAPHNVEQVPAENSAVKLVQKDRYLGYEAGCEFYSNQFIPLTVNCDMLERLKLQGKFDKLFSGGAIAHINVEVAIDDPQKLVDLVEYAAKCGAIYFAVNYKIKVCENSHLWVGSEDRCPKCGAEWKETITRVVGFFTNVKNWNKVRREHDWPNRQFYK